ncbi:hypothetical protein [Paludisphaera mucosa]|uniref:Uncharacterized protein n=1 Tax=Paludisphaera mucosa TaxID=3030827 RepID=A0ABT6F894_9BACT|nr:hypothetical protein [Paludisphaera mucosa]MDG3003817.1 hypothetical protein [Paludisphaera mucosa]
MNRTARGLLRILGIGRPAPRTRLGRVLRRFERPFVALTLAYAALHAFPQVLFAHSIRERGITLYSSRPIPPAAAERLGKARDLIDRCELAAPGRTERIFLCNSPWLYRFFAPLSGGAFAVSAPLTDNVFVAAADLDADVACSLAAEYRTRAFTGLVAHEATHGLIRRRLGLWRASRLPLWLVEGYCDYVAGGGSFPEAEGRRLDVAGETHPSPAFRYFQYRMRVTRLLEQEHRTFDDLARIGGSVDRR